MKFPPPLRFSIPGLILILGSGLITAHFTVILHLSQQRTLEEVLEQATRQAARLADLAVHSSEKDDAEQLKNGLHYLFEDTDLKYAVVCDANDNIVAAMRDGWNARPILGTGASDAVELLARVRSTHLPQSFVLRERDLVIAAHPVKSATDDSSPGIALVERDLSSSDEAAKRHALHDTAIIGAQVAVFCVVLWLALGFIVLPRSRRALEAARRIHGDSVPAAPLEGGDEFAEIVRALRDAHQRMLTQARDIQEQNDRYLRLVGTLPAMVLITRDDRIESINQAGLDMLGAATPDQVLGRSPFDIIHPDHHAALRDRVRVMTRTGASVPGMEEKVVRLDGTTLDVEAAASPFRDGRGPAIQIVMRDISERKAGEARRVALSRDLEEKNKELEAIVYAASHDLRSPLLNVMGFSRQLAGACQKIGTALANGAAPASAPALEPVVNTTMPRALQFIEQGVSKMDALISGFLQYSRSGRHELNLRALDMDALLHGVADAMTYQVQQTGAELRIEKLPPCQGDATQLNQVFTNLLDNALKYRKPGAPCIISVQGHTGDGCAIYTVTDNGIGISAEHQQKIFEIFHRLDSSSVGGEGLGLTIARRIVQRHGGSINVESSPGAGSTFTVILPAPP